MMPQGGLIRIIGMIPHPIIPLTECRLEALTGMEAVGRRHKLIRPTRPLIVPWNITIISHTIIQVKI